MRKAIFTFIAIVLVAMGIYGYHSCNTRKSEIEVFERTITYADMTEYINDVYGFAIRVPSFFSEEADSLRDEKGHLRFGYHDEGANIVLEGYVIYHQGQDNESGMDSLAGVLHATSQKPFKGGFILSGPHYEDGRYVDGYSFYTKYVRSGKVWFAYSLFYPDRYRESLSRLFQEIDEWQIWERPRLQFKQAVDQTPRALSE